MLRPLLQLPNELLDHVFAFLDTTAPSERDFNYLPSFTCSTPSQQALKNVSLVSRRLRTIVFERLFTHVRIYPDSVPDFLQFINRFDLSWKVESIMIKALSDRYIGTAPTWWCLLLNQVPTRRVIIQVQPEAYDALFGLGVNLQDSWAFKIPCQYIELGQRDLFQRTLPCEISTGLLAAKQWQSIKINEGSSLAAYTSYEYFLKKPPSLLAIFKDHLRESTPPLEDLTAYRAMARDLPMKIMATDKMIDNLQMFSYTAVFPFYNHVDEILCCVRRMKNLRKLYIKLCPEPGSSILEDAIQAASGHIDLNDPWSEVNIAYTLVAHHVLYLGQEGPMESLVSGDVGVAGIRDSIVGDVSEKLMERWTFDGQDTWTKRTADESIEAVQTVI